MTTAQLDQQLLDHLGDESGNETYSDADMRYRFLSRAYRYIMRNTRATMERMATWALAVNDESFNLSTQLSLAAGESVYDVVRAFYLVDSYTQIRLVPTNYSAIKAFRSELSGSGQYPRCFAFRRSGATKIPYLEIYPAACNAGSNILFIDWIKEGADLTSSQDPITPAYAHDAEACLAAAYILQSIGADGWRDKMAEAMVLVRDVKAQSYKEDRRQIISRINV